MCIFPSYRYVESRLGSRFSRAVLIPCGKCSSCLKKRQDSWKIRLCEEAKNWKYTYFLTLTYRNDVLPCNVVDNEFCNEIYWSGTLPSCVSFLERRPHYKEFCSIKSTTSVYDIQCYIKRIRRNSGLDFKYFICSEYGPSPKGTKRPHYHGLIFSDSSFNELAPHFNTWSADYGRMEFKLVGAEISESRGTLAQQRSKVCNYVSKYCAKGEFNSRKEDISYGHISKAFFLASKNLGLSYLDELTKNLFEFLPNYLGSDFYKSDCEYTEQDVYNIWLNDMDNPIWKEIDSLIRHLCYYDGDIHKYTLPRYYYERLFCKQYNFDKVVLATKKGKPIYDLFLDINSIKFVYGNSKFSNCSFRQSFCKSYSPLPITFKTSIRKDKRYMAVSFLSHAISIRLRLQSDNCLWKCYAESVTENQLFFPTKEDLEQRSAFYLSALRDLQARRQSVAKSNEEKLSSFYTNNMFINKEFDSDVYYYESYSV